MTIKELLRKLRIDASGEQGRMSASHMYQLADLVAAEVSAKDQTLAALVAQQRDVFIAGWSAGFQEALTPDKYPDQDRCEVAFQEWLKDQLVSPSTPEPLKRRQVCPRCHGTGECSNAQFQCMCRHHEVWCALVQDRGDCDCRRASAPSTPHEDTV